MISEIRLFELLKTKIGKEEAEAFLEILESKVDKRIIEQTNIFATKEDLAHLQTKVVEKISDTKVDIIKCMIGTSIGIVGVLIAVLKLI